MSTKGIDDEKLHKIAKIRLKRAVATLYKLIEEENISFDIVLAGGNSGVMYARITQMVYDFTEKEPPFVIKVPFVRYKPDSEEIPENRLDNDILQYDIKNQIRDYNIKEIETILFVDTEIGYGTTAQTCFELTQKATYYYDGNKINYYIVAEDFGFKPFEVTKNIDIHFYPCAKGIKGIYEIVTNILPKDIEEKLRIALPKPLYEKQHLINVLLDLPCRSKDNPLEGFNLKINEVARQRVEDIDQLKVIFSDYLQILVRDAIQEYKNGGIDLANNDYMDSHLST